MSDRTPPRVRAARGWAPRHGRQRTGGARGVLLVLCAVLSVGSGTLAADGDEAETSVAARVRPSPSAVPPTPSPAPAPPCVPAPLERRAAATLVVGLPGVVRSDETLAQEVVDLGVGGVFLSESNVHGRSQVAALSAGLRAAAGRPLLVATDEESGRVALMRDVVGAGPSPRRLAQRESPEQVRERAAATGTALAGVGVDLDLAPVLDLDDGPSGGVIGDRSFSADPTVASQYGLAYAAGLADAGVTPTVKHFPGHGRSRVDSHRASDVVDAGLDELAATDLAPFRDAIAAGVPVVMLNHLQYAALDPELPASLSPRAYALLRDLGFTGVAITDSVGMGAVNLRWDFPEAAVQAVTAGADAVLTTDGAQAVRMRDALVDAVRTGRVPEARVSQAAARVTALAGGDPVAMSCLEVDMPAFPAAAVAPAS